jgi:flagellar basal-body rod modification protein FlgD
MPDQIAMTSSMMAPNALHGSVDSAMSALGGMDSEGFLNLLVAQLKYQSPLEPKDPGDLMTQTAVLAQLDATQQLLAVQQRELGLSQAVAAAGMLGTEVTGTGQDGMSVTGVVEAVRYTEAGPVLDLGGREVLFAEVRSLRSGSGTGGSGGADTGGSDDGATTVAADGRVPGTIPIEG